MSCLKEIFNDLRNQNKISEAVYRRAYEIYLNGAVVEVQKTIRVTRTEEDIQDSWSLVDIISKKVPKGWESLFDSLFEDMVQISSHIDSEQYLPAKPDIFRVFELCSLEKVRVVILGQDPYHSLEKNQPVAMGLSFSVRRGFKVPPSLKNIYKELQDSIPSFKVPDHGDLTPWVQEGVFLLNTCLTVRPHKAKSHGRIWIGFITKVLDEICKQNPRTIFVLWGREAQLFKSKLKTRGLVLEATHPSPLSANRGGFFGCGHFTKINQKLEELGQKPIDWSL